MSQIVSLPVSDSVQNYQSLQQPLVVTQAAAMKIRQLMLEEGNSKLALRVYIQGGGCSGFQYGFEFCESHEADDVVIEREGIHLIVDPLSLQYLLGAEVDYSETLAGAQFIVRNPNAKTTCGCGSSFNI